MFKIQSEDQQDIEQTKTYLISEKIVDIDEWLKKKFDKIFTFELDLWVDNKKEWPQKGNFKMFKEWFRVDISTMIYDFERNPIKKSF